MKTNKKPLRAAFLYSFAALGLCLSACSGLGPGQADAQPSLDARYQYLRFTHQDLVAWLVKGYVDHWSAAGRRPSAVWFSADKSVVKTSQGRLTLFSNKDFRLMAQASQDIDWAAIVVKPMAQTLDLQVDDSLRGDARRVQTRLEVSPQPPVGHRYSGPARDLVWVREYTVSDSALAQGGTAWPDAWYALDARAVGAATTALWPVYGQMCADAQRCFSWQLTENRS